MLRASKDLNSHSKKKNQKTKQKQKQKKRYKINLVKESRSWALKMNFGYSILRKMKIRAKIKDVRSKAFFNWYGRLKEI